MHNLSSTQAHTHLRPAYGRIPTSVGAMPRYSPATPPSWKVRPSCCRMPTRLLRRVFKALLLLLLLDAAAACCGCGCGCAAFPRRDDMEDVGAIEADKVETGEGRRELEGASVL